jgi:hypothetical protein
MQSDGGGEPVTRNTLKVTKHPLIVRRSSDQNPGIIVELVYYQQIRTILVTNPLNSDEIADLITPL